MKKCRVIVLFMVIIFFISGCNMKKDMFGTSFGIAYFNKPEDTPKVTYIYHDFDTLETMEVELKNDGFCDKLGALIDGKIAGCDFCKCTGDYQVTIDDKYLFYLHPDKIVVYTDLEDYDGFTVKCSSEETKVLYDIIESQN